MKHPWHRGALRHLAARHRGRTIGLYGGSFNPAHAGHLHVAKEALKRLKLDEIWFLVSPGNPLKPDTGMAPFGARLESLKCLINAHPTMLASDIEAKLGTRYTVDTVEALKYELPRTKFVWLMGADNLEFFEKWHRWHDIATSLPIAVFDRTGYDQRGFASELARRFAQFRTTPNHFTADLIPSWTFVTIPRHPASATEIRSQHSEPWHADKKGKDT